MGITQRYKKALSPPDSCSVQSQIYTTLVRTIMNVLCRKRLVVALRTHIRAKRRVNHTHFVQSSSARSIRVLPSPNDNQCRINVECGGGSKGSSRLAPQWLIGLMNNACMKQSLDMHGLYREEKQRTMKCFKSE